MNKPCRHCGGTGVQKPGVSTSENVERNAAVWKDMQFRNEAVQDINAKYGIKGCGGIWDRVSQKIDKFLRHGSHITEPAAVVQAALEGVTIEFLLSPKDMRDDILLKYNGKTTSLRRYII